MTKRPNVILVMVDNQSAQTLGCYGNADSHTPHIDRLARDGMQFDEAYCPNALCSPGRASALTGLMPSQHGVHSWLDDRSLEHWPANWSAVAEFHTLPRVLRNAGYATGLIGKYHLGVPHVPQEGFEHWTALVRGHTLSFYDSVVIKNGQESVAPGHSVDFLTAEALRFIDARAHEPERPFFLFLTYNGPYGHWPAIKNHTDNRFAARYDQSPMLSVPRQGLSQTAIDYVRLQQQFGLKGKGGPDYDSLLKAPNDLASLRSYFSEVSIVDNGMGQVMAALEGLGLDEDTLIIYTADHGFSLGHHGFWGHGVATWPANAHRAAYNVPMVWRHPKRVAAGGRCARLVSSVDLYATLMRYLDIPDIWRNEISPSRDMGPLLGDPSAEWEDCIFIDQEETRAVRTPDRLYLRRFAGSATYPLDDSLYNLRDDPEERCDLTAREEGAPELAARIDTFFARYSDQRYDLWRGGAPKSNTSRSWLWRDAWGSGWSPLKGMPRSTNAS
jgi:arylsulfatase A-like enzyme